MLLKKRVATVYTNLNVRRTIKMYTEHICDTCAHNNDCVCDKLGILVIEDWWCDYWRSAEEKNSKM